MILESLASLSLPDSQVSLLQPSVQLGRARKTQKQFLNDVELQTKLLSLRRASQSSSAGDGKTKSSTSPGNTSCLLGTSWGRRNRKRRPLKAEKVLLDPKPPGSVPEESDVGSEAGSDLEIADEDDGELIQLNCGALFTFGF